MVQQADSDALRLLENKKLVGTANFCRALAWIWFCAALSLLQI